MSKTELADAVALDQWFWIREQPGQTAAQLSSPDMNTADWAATDPAQANTNGAQMNYTCYARFRTVLPEMAGPGRTVSFPEVAALLTTGFARDANLTLWYDHPGEQHDARIVDRQRADGRDHSRRRRTSTRTPSPYIR